jgi:type VI protein secretion system component VasK
MSISSSGKDLTEGAGALSVALMTGAFGVIAAAIFGVAAFFDKIERTPLVIGLILSALGIAALAASVIFGGRGIAYGATAGPNNRFDLQAKCGALGLGLVLASAFVFALNKKPDEKAVLERKVEALEQDVRTLKPEVQGLNARVVQLQAGLDSMKSKASQTGGGKRSAGSRTSGRHHTRKP